MRPAERDRLLKKRGSLVNRGEKGSPGQTSFWIGAVAAKGEISRSLEMIGGNVSRM